MGTSSSKAVRTTRGIRGVLVVGVIALAGFGAAMVAFADDARLGCVIEAPLQPSYTAEFVGEIVLEKTEQDIAVKRDGQPVVGAKVCARVSMVGMEAMGVSDATAEEASPGIYRVKIVFAMSGGWRGNILISEDGRPPVAAPLKFDVA